MELFGCYVRRLAVDACRTRSQVRIVAVAVVAVASCCCCFFALFSWECGNAPNI